MRLDNGGLLILNSNNAGSAGTAEKQISLGDSNGTAWSSTNVGTFSGAIISNSSGTTGTGCGIAFSHQTGSSGISYIVSKNGGNDRSSLHFGTRGSDGVARRMLIGQDGEIEINANSNNKASLNIDGTGTGAAPNDGKLYVTKNSNNDWMIKCIAGNDNYGIMTKGAGAHAFYVEKHDVGATFRVHHDGIIYLVNTSLQSISDERLKENIVDANSQWDDIKGLRFRNYNWKDNKYGSEKFLGLIAQEVELVSPGLVGIDAQSKEDINAGVEDPEYKNVNYSIVWMKAVKPLQEAMEKIETLEAKVEALENA